MMLIAVVANDVTSAENALERLGKCRDPLADDEERGADEGVGQDVEDRIRTRWIGPIIEGEGNVRLGSAPVRVIHQRHDT
jgi:hypothetical protein